MARPALIVGLGGTGQWVLTWLKRDLLLSNNGEMPKNIRLLAMDTTTQLEAGTTRVTTSGKKEEAAEVGGVMLDKSEFIHVGGDSLPIAERVRDGKLEQIGQWYHAEKWLSLMPPSMFVLDDGAGRIRQFGRMAVFKDMLGQEVGSQIWRALRNAIESVRPSTSEQRQLEVVVVGSFAGGTGSGMFTDTALILRMAATQLKVHHILRGFFALPSVFTTTPDDEMLGRSFAAWRELNRFMVIDPDFTMPLIQYVENSSTFRIRPEKRLFDACYLVDGKRGGQTITAPPKYGVFPMLSEVISAILDEQAGTLYTQWVSKNLAEEYARYPETPMYSTVGAFTVQVPAHFVQEVSGHKFAQKILLQLLRPGQELSDLEEDDRLVASGAERHLALAAPDQNQEDRGFAGRERSRRHLRESATYDGKNTKPTLFHSRIAQIVDQAFDENKHAQIVEALAKAGVNPRSTDSWVAYFPQLGDDPTFENVRQAVNEYMTFDVRKSYSRREGEKETEARSKFKNIPEDIRTRFGGITSSGEEIETFHGKCGDVLQECEDVQLILFRQLTGLRLSSILNGNPNNDAMVARSGKLGYARDYFDGLVDEFSRFLSLMEEIRKRREQIKPELKVQGLNKKAKDMLAATREKKIFWFWEHPHVKGAEQAYLRAQQRMVDLRREDILHYYVVETAEKMREMCVQIRDTLERWIWHLATGDDASQLPGIWDGVRKGLQDVKNAFSYDHMTSSENAKMKMLLAEEAVDITKADLEKALQQWQWEVNFTNGNPPKARVQAKIIPDAENASEQTLKPPWKETSSELRMHLGVQNRETLMSLARRRFVGVAARTTVAEEIKQTYPEPTAFADKVAGVSAEPLFDKDPEASPRKKSNLIRVHIEPNDPYFVGAQGLEGELRDLAQLERATRDDNYGIQVVDSENPYKMTLVRTDDLYRYNHYAAWNSCQTAYAKHMLIEGDPMDPTLLQNFAAEIRAVDYERRLTRSGDEYRPLHPRVVMLLEDPFALRQFIYLGMLGNIGEKESGRVYRWELNWTKSRGPQTIWLTRGWNVDKDKANRPKPSIVNAIHGYVIMKRTQQPGRRDRIDTEFAQRLIDKEIKKLGSQGEIKFLRRNLGENGLVGWLKNEAYDQDVPDRIARQDYADMATVIELMIRERLEELEAENSITQQIGKSSSPFFRVSDEEESQRDAPISSDTSDAVSQENSSEELEDASADPSDTPWQIGS